MHSCNEQVHTKLVDAALSVANDDIQYSTLMNIDLKGILDGFQSSIITDTVLNYTILDLALEVV